MLKSGILKFFRNLVFLTFFEYLIRYRKVKKEAVREMAVEGEKDYGRNYRTKRDLRVNIHRDREALRHIKLQRKDMKQRTEIVQR